MAPGSLAASLGTRLCLGLGGFGLGGFGLGLVLACGGMARDGDRDTSVVAPFGPEQPSAGGGSRNGPTPAQVEPGPGNAPLSGGGVSTPAPLPGLEDCPCASTASLMALACGGRKGGRALATSDGSSVLFSLCQGSNRTLSMEEVAGRCDVARWTLGVGSGLLMTDAEPRGLSTDRRTLLVQGAVPMLFKSGGMVSELPLLAGFALSIDGFTVLGSIKAAPVPQVVRWSAAAGIQAIELGQMPAGAAGAEAVAMSIDGSVVAGFTVDGQARALEVFRWTQTGGLVSIAPAFRVDDVRGADLWLSGDGSVLGGTLDLDPSPEVQVPVPFRWTEATGMARLEEETPGSGERGVLHGFSADGRLAVGTSYSSGPFVWDDVRGFRQLDESLKAAGVSLEGWGLDRALAVSGDGRVVVGHGACGELSAVYRAVIPD